MKQNQFLVNQLCWVVILLFFLIPLPSKAQNEMVTIMGAIFDSESKETLIGASVSVSGSTVGTITNASGEFKLSVPKNAKLVVSYIGYKSTTIAVNSQKKISVFLESNAALLQEMVVIGFGQQKKITYTGSVSTVNGSILKESTAGNLTQTLAGRLPGLVTNQISGQPGADEAKFFIRGRATFSGSVEPLVIVDGIERAMSQIDVNEVEGISILKDASATAVYGVRGANGVIIVTTKQGSYAKPQINFSYELTATNPLRVPKTLDSYQYAYLYNEASINDGKGPFYSAEALQGYKDVVASGKVISDDWRYANVNQYKEFTNPVAFQHRYNVNVSGGGKIAKYFISASFFNQDGMFKYTTDSKRYDSNANYNRFNLRSNITFNVTDYLTIKTGLGFIPSFKTNGGTIEGPESVLRSIIMTPSTIYWKNPDGSLNKNSKFTNNYARIARSGFKETNNNTLQSNFELNLKLDMLTKGLAFNVLGSFDSMFGFTRAYTETAELFSYEPISKTYSFGELPKPFGWYDHQFNGMDRQYYAETKLTYNRTFNEKHNFDALVLWNFRENNIKHYIPYRYLGLVGRLQYSYKEKYLTDVNFGYQGSENFAPGKRFGFFPAMSLGWIISKEDFFKSSALSTDINLMKVRMSAGQSGNDRIGNDRFLYQSNWRPYYNGGWDQPYYKFGDNKLVGTVREGRISSPDVTWERSNKLDLALEMEFLKSTVGFVLDGFYERRQNILQLNNSAPRYALYTSGGTIVSHSDLPILQGGFELTPFENSGEVENYGFELELFYKKRFANKLNLQIKPMVSFARNKILYYSEPGGNPEYQKLTGKPIGTHFGYVSEGFFNDWDDVANSPTQNFKGPVQPGDLKYADINDDGQITVLDQKNIGYTEVPEWNGSLAINLDYKGLDFSMLWQGVTNVNKYLSNTQLLPFFESSSPQSFHLERWAYYKDPYTGEQIDTRATATYPRLTSEGKGSNTHVVSTYTLFDGSYIKLRNMQIGYTFPESTLKPLGLNSLRVYLSGQNLLTIDKIKFADPELQSAEGNLEGGRFYPINRLFTFGLNVRF